jgi:F-type H+-transporting ATPase subunit delta
LRPITPEGIIILAGTKGTAAGLATRYATALFELASEQDALERTAADLRAILEAVNAEPALARAIRSPIVPRDELISLITALAERLGLSPLVRNFLGLLAQQRRLFALRLMVERFEQMLAAHRGEVTAEVASAVPLDEEQIAALREALAARVGKAVRLATRVDPELLGGLVVRLGSRMIDASLRSRLQQLELAMKGVG